jgi:hypothetical protein
MEWMKSAIATSIRARALGSIKLPQSFIWVTGAPLTFFPPLGLKNKLGVLVHGVLLLRLELSVTAQERFNAGRAGKLSSVLPPTSTSVELADDLRDNACGNGRETYSKV